MTRAKTLTRMTTLLLAVCIFASLAAVSVNAAGSSSSCIQFGYGYEAAWANLSNAWLPNTPSSLTQGESIYLNLAATTDWYLKSCYWYVAVPGGSYSLVSSYTARGYYRYTSALYQLAYEGTYKLKVVITTTNGSEMYGETSFYVNPSTSGSANQNTYSLNGTSYNVVPNFSSNYCFNQNDYSRFVNSSGRNTGCTATAMCICYSIYHNQTLSPNSVAWSTDGTSWEYATRYADSNKTYNGRYYTQAEGLKAMYNCVSGGKPMIVGVSGKVDHVVAVVGVRSGADSNNLSLSDFLIVDPWGGNVKALSSYTGLDTSWSLRIPS